MFYFVYEHSGGIEFAARFQNRASGIAQA